MTISIKEQILVNLENTIKSIRKGSLSRDGYVYENTMEYVDRQYQQINEEEMENKPKPWIIINNEYELFNPLPSRTSENKVIIDIIGFVQATDESPNLDTLMNSLQKDLVVAILTDETIGGIAAWTKIRQIATVPQMIYPYGGFAMTIEVNYAFNGINI